MKENQVPRTRLCIAWFVGVNYIKEMKYLLKTKHLSRALMCVCACARVRVSLCVRVCHAYVGIHRPTHSAPRRSGCLPPCSTPGRLPSSGVLSCSVSQHCSAPTRTMNCVTFEQTHVMHRGASPVSTGSSTVRTYILTLAPETAAHTQTHADTHMPSSQGKGSACSSLSAYFFPYPRKPPDEVQG